MTDKQQPDPDFGLVSLAWGDGKHRFRLTLEGIEELEDRANAGVFQVYQRLRTMETRAKICRETLRLGLIGGGMPQHEALDLMERYFGNWPLTDSLLKAKQVLDAVILGPAAAPAPRKRAAKAEPANG